MRLRAAAAAGACLLRDRCLLPPPADLTTILQRTTVALTQLHRLLQTATDILSDLHSIYLAHTHQVDPHLHRTFPPLPAPPARPLPVPSTTSSCDTPPPRLSPPAKPNGQVTPSEAQFSASSTATSTSYDQRLPNKPPTQAHFPQTTLPSASVLPALLPATSPQPK